MIVKPGDVVVVDLGTSIGHEQSGRRPAIIVSVTNRIALLIPLTSNTATLRFAAAYLMAPSKKNGLEVDSIALVFQLRAMDARRIETRIGTLDAKDVREINSILNSIARI